MRFLSLKSSTFHKILYFCVPKDGVNASAFSCMSSSGDRTFSFARQISQSPFLHQRNDQWRSILLSNFSFYRLVIIEKMLKFSLFFSKKRKLQHFQKTPKTIKISKGISMIKFQHGCVYIGMELNTIHDPHPVFRPLLESSIEFAYFLILSMNFHHFDPL